MCLWRYREIWLITKGVISNDINHLLYSNSRWESSLFSLVLTYKNLHNSTQPSVWRAFDSSSCKLVRQESNDLTTQEATVCPSTQFGLMPYHPAICPSSSLPPLLALLPPSGSLYRASCQPLSWLLAAFTLYTHLEPSWTLPERTKSLSFLVGLLPSLLRAIVSWIDALCFLQLFDYLPGQVLGGGYKVV